MIIDFFSGSHGHFLEYVINTWMFGGPRVHDVFTPLGACHGIRVDKKYMDHRIICAQHFTEKNLLPSMIDPDRIVVITIDSEWGNLLYQINIMCRAGDIPIEEKMLHIPNEVRTNVKNLRNEWYSKFGSKDHGYQLPSQWKWKSTDIHKFPMESMFDIQEFYQQLQKTASYLNITFSPDQELATLVQNFWARNQGWQYFNQAKNIVQAILLGHHVNFQSDEILQGLINSMLSRSIGIFDGSLFASDSYPNSSTDIAKIVRQHVENFDRRF